jgi:hypothetical protein
MKTFKEFHEEVVEELFGNIGKGIGAALKGGAATIVAGAGQFKDFAKSEIAPDLFASVDNFKGRFSQIMKDWSDGEPMKVTNKQSFKEKADVLKVVEKNADSLVLFIEQEHFAYVSHDMSKLVAKDQNDREYTFALADLEFEVKPIDAPAEDEQRLDDKCWDGYSKQGTKMKGGVRVNNCVKK